MKCDDVYRHICENLDQEIDSPQCREIKRHLESCPDCTAYLDSLRRTVSLYRVLPAPSLSKSAERELFKTIDLVVASHTRPRSGAHISKTKRRSRGA